MQTGYSVNQAEAVPGVLADLTFHQIETFLNGGAAGAGFGLAAVDAGTGDIRAAKVPTATGQAFRGLTVKTDEFSQKNGGAVGYPVGQRMNLLRRGRLYVQASGAVTEGTQPYFNAATGQLGPQAVPADTAVYAKNAGATGNFTASAVTAAAPAQAGTYVGTFTDATHFDLVDPSGNFVASGVDGTPFAAGGLGFTITAGGTAAVEGDGFHITVTQAAATTDPVPRAVWRTTTTGAGIAIVEINLP